MKKIDDLIVEREKYYSKSLMEKSSLIVACHLPTYGIGNNGDLLFNIKEDLKHFMNITKGNIVVMGRGTWDSLPRKPLKNRINIIISENSKDKLETEIIVNKYIDTLVVNNFKILLKYLKENSDEKEIFYIGGESIYKTVVEHDLIKKMYITEIQTSDNNLQVDTFFDYSKYPEYIKKYNGDTNKHGDISYNFTIYERNKN